MKDPLYDEWWEVFGQPGEKPVPNEPPQLDVTDGEVHDICDFCGQNKADIFSLEWDAALCNDCDDAQREKMDRARHEA